MLKKQSYEEVLNDFMKKRKVSIRYGSNAYLMDKIGGSVARIRKFHPRLDIHES